MHRSTRLLIFSATGLALVGALAWVALRPVPVAVEIAEVTRGPMTVTVDVDAVTRIREVFEVAAPIAGTALRSPVRVGDPVVAGETLVAEVRPVRPSLLDARSLSQAEAAVREAEAALEVSKARFLQSEEDLAYAQSQFDRAQALVERGVATLVRLEDAAQALKVSMAARDTAVSSRTMAQGALERAKAALIGPEELGGDTGGCCVQIHAPADGVVLSIDRISERPVLAGERLLGVGDPADLEIIADPLSRDAVRIPPGARAMVDRWGGANMLEARLKRIEPAAYTEVSALGIEEQRVEAIFDFTSPREAHAKLGDGYALRLAIEVWSADAALRVPIGALFRANGDWVVFTVENGRAHLATVKIGERNARVAEVLSGLDEGTYIVTHPSDGVTEGALVTPLERN